MKISTVILAAGLSLLPLASSRAQSQPPKPVVVAHVTEAVIQSGQRVIGTVRPLRTSTIGSAIDGRVKAFMVNEGDAVQEGQILAQLRTETLKIEEAAAKAELELAAQRLAALENGSLPEDIAEAEANMLSAKAAVKNAQSKLKRVKSLETRSAASKAELDDANEQADAAQFALQATEALLKRIQDGPRAELIAQARAQVEIQRQRLNLAADRVAKASILAPFDGFVSAEFTEVGAWITRGDPIAEVIQMDQVEVHAPVTAESAINLRKGDMIRVEFPELPNELLTGSIDRIVPVATSRARTFPVQIRLQNRIRKGTPMLMAGMLARVEVPAGKRQPLPLVPKDALVLNGNDRSVFIIDKAKGEARKVNVSLGVAHQDRIQVRGDLSIGDLVVVVGNERLLPNAKVKVVREITSPGPEKSNSESTTQSTD